MKQIARIVFFDSPDEGGIATEFKATPEYFNNDSKLAHVILGKVRDKFIKECQEAGLFKAR